MAWRIVICPNGKYARYSDVVDNFTDYDMTRDEAFELCRDAAGVDTANYKLTQAESHPERFEQEMERIKEFHGSYVADALRKELSAVNAE